MHIHSSSPNSSLSEENAATKIQAGFRGYRVRKQLQQKPRSTNDEKPNAFYNNVNGNGTSDGTKQQALDTIIETNSATKIQAGVRGYLVRKKQRLASEAATKIQAGFRGFKVRKDMKKPHDMKI